jgi:hypothetical protein
VEALDRLLSSDSLFYLFFDLVLQWAQMVHLVKSYKQVLPYPTPWDIDTRVVS